MGRGDKGDETESTGQPTQEATGKGAVPDAPRPPAPPEEPGAVTRNRRGPGMWLPLLVFVALLVAGAVGGSLIVPGAGPDPGSVPPVAEARPTLTRATAVQPTPTGPAGPTLPAPPVREADRLAPWAQRIGAAANVPPVAVQAYGYAQLTVAATDPSCHLGWTTLAAIGEVESTHGQLGGAMLQPNGRSSPLIVGPVLDGKNGQALVKDTDAGAFDGDPTYDRAMGPLALTPTVWRGYGIDADGDAILDPFDIDDAALALARLLCSGAEDLSQRAGWDAALARHHAGSAYSRSVFTLADSYGQRTKDVR